MDAEIKRKWVEALRSGKYAQTKSHLRDHTGYCCLGVLCDIVAPSLWEEADEMDDYFDHLRANSFPHPDILRQAGITDDTDSDVQHPLWTAAHMNDDGYGFGTIADFIEASL